MQGVRRPPTKLDVRATDAFHGCIPACDHSDVPDYDPETVAAALAELDRLTADFSEATKAAEAKRAALHAAIVRHLRERSAPPGEIASHVPYDRNYVRKLGDAAGVPPLRTPTVRAVKRARKKAS